MFPSSQVVCKQMDLAIEFERFAVSLARLEKEDEHEETKSIHHANYAQGRKICALGLGNRIGGFPALACRSRSYG